jgi:hypothetical protein
LIHELAPNVSVGAVLINPNNPNAQSVARDARESARSLGLQFHVLNAGTDQDIDTHAWIGAYGDSNAGAIETPEGIIVIDTQQYPRFRSR